LQIDELLRHKQLLLRSLIMCTAQTNSVTIRDVASRAGVSIGTVSRIFKNQGGLTEETRQEALRAALELGCDICNLHPNVRVNKELLGKHGVESLRACRTTQTLVATDLIVCGSCVAQNFVNKKIKPQMPKPKIEATTHVKHSASCQIPNKALCSSDKANQHSVSS
jgi:transcriptional regulator with XRE-family HTH domain